ncbi:DUF2949 domain-containing protein [Nostoc sp.]
MAITAAAISLAFCYVEQTPMLPMVLWQYGLITVTQPIFLPK